MDPRRWTPLTYLAPARYVDRNPSWATFDLHEWADEEYDWVQDPWNGFLDVARRPHETVAAGEGDCEDFALVAVTWAVANDREVGLGFCFEAWTPWPTHVIAYDDMYVYSSGNIVPASVDEWVADTDRYAFVLRRRVR
jgi:hypothetical protein